MSDFTPVAHVVLDGEEAKLARDVGHALDLLAAEHEQMRTKAMRNLAPLLDAHEVPRGVRWQVVLDERGHWCLQWENPPDEAEEAVPRPLPSRTQRRQAVRDARKAVTR